MTDEDIMEAIRKGDLQKASLLFERYHRPLYHFMLAKTRDRDRADDLTQNVFLRMLRYRTSFKGNHFRGWLYQIGRNVLADHYRELMKTKMQTDVSELEHLYLTPEVNPDEREKLLFQSMSKLTSEEQELLIMTRFQRMKYEQVAELLDTTAANIKVKVHRTINKLREHYFELEKTA